VIAVLAIWVVVAVAYYPVRRRYLAAKGIDLDRLTTNDDIFSA